MYVGTPLLCLLTAQSMPETQPLPSFPVAVTATASGGFFRQVEAGDGRMAGGELAGEWYPRQPLVDDGTPLGLAPYLQRLDRVAVGGRVTWLGTKADASQGERSGHSAEGWLAALLHRKWALLGAGLDYARAGGRALAATTAAVTAAQGFSVERLRPSVTLGVRDGAFEARGTYAWATYSEGGAWRAPSWGQATIAARLVLDQYHDTSLQAYTLGQGAGISGRYEVFPTPRLSFWAGGTYENGRIYDRYMGGCRGYEVYMDDESGWLGELGVGVWLSSMFAVYSWVSGGFVNEICMPRQEPDEGGAAYSGVTLLKQVIFNVALVTRVPGR